VTSKSNKTPPGENKGKPTQFELPLEVEVKPEVKKPPTQSRPTPGKVTIRLG
jgi:hypothetical protein